MLAIGDRVRVEASVPYYATITRFGRPGTWYPGGASEIMVAPEDGRPVREVLSSEVTRVGTPPAAPPTLEDHVHALEQSWHLPAADPPADDLRAIYSAASRYLRALYADQPSPHATKDNADRLARIAESLHAKVSRG